MEGNMTMEAVSLISDSVSVVEWMSDELIRNNGDTLPASWTLSHEAKRLILFATRLPVNCKPQNHESRMSLCKRMYYERKMQTRLSACCEASTQYRGVYQSKSECDDHNNQPLALTKSPNNLILIKEQRNYCIISGTHGATFPRWD